MCAYGSSWWAGLEGENVPHRTQLEPISKLKLC